MMRPDLAGTGDRQWEADATQHDGATAQKDPLKILIVTLKLLTGFDAPILQTIYPDKPLRDPTLLKAICRTNRSYGEHKTHGLIVDELGIFDDIAQVLADGQATHFRLSAGVNSGLLDDKALCQRDRPARQMRSHSAGSLPDQDVRVELRKSAPHRSLVTERKRIALPEQFKEVDQCRIVIACSPMR
jgi:hypothetical protein